MFKKLLFKSVVSATAVGSALTVSLVSTPAVVTTAPEIRTVACGDAYTPRLATSTSVSFIRDGASVASGEYGSAVRGVATVSSSGGTPTGNVRFVLWDSTRGSQVGAWTAPMSRGAASLALPTYLPAQRTYRLSADYRPSGCFKDAETVGKSYTVVSRRTSTRATAPNRTRRQTPLVDVTVGSSISQAVTGKVSVVVRRSGSVVRRGTVTLSRESGRIGFRRLSPGLYTVTATYLGNTNFRVSSDRDDFRVYRR